MILQLEHLANRLVRQQLQAFAPRSVILGRGAHWGVGVRSEAALPFSGTLHLIHWIVSPYDDTPAGGIVEDCVSARLRRVWGDERSWFGISSRGAASAPPAARLDRRNLVSATQLMGLRGWDVPHDRHAAVMDLSTGSADVSGIGVSGAWHAAWSCIVRLPGVALQLEISGGEAVEVSTREPIPRDDAEGRRRRNR